MLQAFFHAWERRLADVTKDRVVRPFDWGLDWIPDNGHAPGASHATEAADAVGDWVSRVMADTDAFFTSPATTDYTLRAAPDGDLLTFPSAFVTPHDANNTVYCRYFQAPLTRRPTKSMAPLKGRPTRSDAGAPTAGDVGHRFSGAGKAAVLVLPQWNADTGGHVGLCRLLAWNGISALRLSLPYHDQRMPPELHRADYLVSANIARTVQVCRQAVLDARRDGK